MTDRDRTTRTRARTPGAEDNPSSKAVHWRTGDPTQRGTSQAEGRMQTERASVYVGSRLKPAAEIGKASSDSQPFSRTGENPTVRNVRGDQGNVGIIRSPVRALILPDCRGAQN